MLEFRETLRNKNSPTQAQVQLVQVQTYVGILDFSDIFRYLV